MADRFDKSYARRPTAGSAVHHDDAELPDDDPLVELARIVSGNESFDQILGSRYQQSEPPRTPVSVRGAAQARDASYDLEAELLDDLHSSFDPDARQPQRPAEPAPVRPAPRVAAQAPRNDEFESLSLRVATPRAPLPAGATREPYVAAPDFGRGRVAPDPAERRAAAPQPQDEDYEDDYVEEDDLSADYDDGDDGYLEEPQFERDKPRRSGKALITAGVVLAVLVVGGLAAFALKGRSSFSGGTPQVIAADQAPTKIEPEPPAQQSQDTQQNKLIYDRADPDQSSPDQLQPPDNAAVTDEAQSNESQASREISRIILPGGPGDQSTTPAVPGAADAPTDGGDDAGPRKVRTVVVKPDGTIVSSEATPRGASPAADAPASDTASSPPSTAEAAPADAPPQPAAPDAAAQATPDEAPLPGTGAKDNSQLVDPTAAPAETETAAAPAVVPEKPAAVSPTPSTGGFVVQVTSQRSEAAAAAAYKNLQKKFPSVLGDRAPDIAKADLGAKGTYFRARVGPMATRDEAVNLCEQLRAAGGDCIVQKN